MGNFVVYYRKEGKLVVNETDPIVVSEIQLNKEMITAGKQYSSVRVNIQNLTEPVSLSLDNLSPNTTYNLYYYEENDGFPKVKTPIYHELVRTSIFSAVEPYSARILELLWVVFVLLMVIN